MRKPLRAVTFDVGNTLFPFGAREMDALLNGFVTFILDRVGRERMPILPSA